MIHEFVVCPVRRQVGLIPAGIFGVVINCVIRRIFRGDPDTVTRRVLDACVGVPLVDNQEFRQDPVDRQEYGFPDAEFRRRSAERDASPGAIYQGAATLYLVGYTSDQNAPPR